MSHRCLTENSLFFDMEIVIRIWKLSAVAIRPF
jgi:hypothetical protein